MLTDKVNIIYPQYSTTTNQNTTDVAFFSR